MKLHYFGDSYDVVKQSLIHWLEPFGNWSMHPMFTDDVTEAYVQELSEYLRVRVISTKRLTLDRVAYFQCCETAENLFLDPDIGLRLKPSRSRRSPGYVYGPELVRIVCSRPASLPLVFDQSVARGKERLQVERKLQYFQSAGVSGVAYVAQACFLLLGPDSALVRRAYEEILTASRLPSWRFVSAEAAQQFAGAP